MKPELPNTQPYAQPVALLMDELKHMIRDCRDTLKAIDRSERLELPIVICRCGAPTVNGKLCTKCEREGKAA